MTFDATARPENIFDMYKFCKEYWASGSTIEFKLDFLYTTQNRDIIDKHYNSSLELTDKYIIIKISADCDINQLYNDLLYSDDYEKGLKASEGSYAEYELWIDYAEDALSEVVYFYKNTKTVNKNEFLYDDVMAEVPEKLKGKECKWNDYTEEFLEFHTNEPTSKEIDKQIEEVKNLSKSE